MRAVIQRVINASVKVDQKIVGQIDKGLLIFLGIGQYDTEEDIDYLVKKVSHLRIFNDKDQKMNLDIHDIQGNCLVISQFTLFASTKKGNRPSFIEAASPELASNLYDLFCDRLSAELSKKVERGIFAADMKVSIVNDGPVTIMIDSKTR
jgi:D-tyrosyl-tRNA(Tyr) deacylase